MKQKLYEVKRDGTIEELCVYINNETPRYNLQTFLMEKLHGCHNWWDTNVRGKVDKLITETDHYVRYEDAVGVVYNILKLSVEQEIARRICKLLKPYGIECEVDGRIDRPENILRASWYVDKLQELGYERCLHIDLTGRCDFSLGFIAVLDGGKIMSGSNVMISDAFTSIAVEMGADENEVIDRLISSNFERYCDDECSGEDGCIICPNYEMFRDFIMDIA